MPTYHVKIPIVGYAEATKKDLEKAIQYLKFELKRIG